MAYADYSLSNTSGYETEEERRRREMAGQVGPVDPASMYQLSSPQGDSGLGLQLPEQVQQQNMQMGQPATLPQMQPQPLQNVDQSQQPATLGEQTGYGHPVQQHLDMYQTAQEDPGALIKMSQDQNAPEWMRSRAREQAANLLNNEKGFATAQQQLKTMSPDDLESSIRKKTTEGSWLKAIMYGALGMEQSAQTEAAKLGIGKESAVMGADGTPYLIKTAANGTPISGYNATTGKQLSANELVTATAGAQTVKGTVTHTGKMQDVTTGEIYYERTTPQGIQLVDTNGKRYSGATNNLRAYGIGSDIATQNIMQVNRLTNEFIAKPSEAAAKTLMEAAAKADPGDGSEIRKVQELIRTLPMPRGGGMPSTTVNQPPQQSIPLYDAQGRPTMSMPSEAAPTVAAPVQPAPLSNEQVTRVDTDIAALDREIKRTPPTETNRLGILNNEKNKLVQYKNSLGGTGAVSGGARRPGESFDAYEQRKALAKSAAEGGIDVNVAEQKQFVEKVIPEVQKKGDDGKFVADTRRTQVSMLTGPNSPIMGIYRGSGTSYDKARAVLRDAVSGVYARTEDPNGLRLSEDLRNISIPAEQLSALKEFVQMNTSINAKTLAENAGEGPKSDADIRMNQAANMTNIGDLPAFAALTGLTRSQFAGDINKRKQDFLNTNRDIYKTQSQLEAVWGKEKDLLNRQYEGIYKARLNYIDSQMVQKFGHDWRKKKDDDTQAFYRNASIHSFNVFSTPNYDTQTQKFVYPTQQSKIAAMRAITGK